jgi:transposase
VNELGSDDEWFSHWWRVRPRLEDYHFQASSGLNPWLSRERSHLMKRNGRQDRQTTKPVERNRAIEVPQLETLKQINLDAAGLDIGDRSIYVCVPAGRDEQPVRVFGTLTADLYAIADWLSQCQVQSVAMESTGVYWIAIFQILEARGFEVLLVNATHIKNVAGKKSDVLDCQWVQQLHTDGLLRPSLRPDDLTCVLRSLVRHREMLTQNRAMHIQHLQKALQQMNLKLTTVLSDVTGQTGLAIVREIANGVQDSQQLAQHRHPCCNHSTEDFVRALTGDYRAEHVFALRQALELFDVYTEKLRVCDAEIEQQLAKFTPKVDLQTQPLPPPTQRPSKRPKNHPPQDIRPALYQLSGVDLTQIDGLDVLTVQTILSEIGTDMSRWSTVKHFTSWLGLSPNNQKTGGKIIRTRTKKTTNRANQAFRQAARALTRSQSALGQFYRRMRAKLGPPKAITATAHKLARIVYYLLKHQVPFAAVPPQQDDLQWRTRALRQLQHQAQKLGMVVVPLADPEPSC